MRYGDFGVQWEWGCGDSFRPPQAAEKILGFGDQFALIFALEIDQIAPKNPKKSPAAAAARLHLVKVTSDHFRHHDLLKMSPAAKRRRPDFLRRKLTSKPCRVG